MLRPLSALLYLFLHFHTDVADVHWFLCPGSCSMVFHKLIVLLPGIESKIPHRKLSGSKNSGTIKYFISQ